MGKRKYAKPDESDESEVEWIESVPNKKEKVDNTKGESICCDGPNDLDNMLNKYTSKSSSQIRNDKVQAEKDKEMKLYEDRLYKAKTEISAPKYDYNWLKKSYFRCLDQAHAENVDVIEYLHIRYDDETIKYMLSKFEGRKSGYSRPSGSDLEPINRYGHRDRISKPNKDSNDKRRGGDLKIDKKDNDNLVMKALKPNNGSQKLNENIDKGDSVIEQRFVTDEDINEASASLIRAEMSGNSSKAEHIKKRLATLREAQRRGLKVKLTRTKKATEKEPETVQRQLTSGRFVPYVEHASQFVASNVDALKKLERLRDGDDMDAEFVRLAARKTRLLAGEDDADREYDDDLEKIGGKNKSQQREKDQQRERDNAVQRHQKEQRCVRECGLCQMPRHLVLTRAEYVTVAVPAEASLHRLHCVIIPREHVASAVRLDEDAYEELTKVMRRVAEFHRHEEDCDTLFLEAVGRLDSQPHCRIDCVPLPRADIGLSAELHFRKAIQDAKSDWCVNRGLLELRKGGIRRTVPREMRYFCVQFGAEQDTDGLAFVVEKDHKFENEFGLRVAADLLGMDELEQRMLRQKKTSWDFGRQADAVMAIEKPWRRYGADLEVAEDDDF